MDSFWMDLCDGSMIFDEFYDDFSPILRSLILVHVVPPCQPDTLKQSNAYSVVPVLTIEHGSTIRHGTAGCHAPPCGAPSCQGRAGRPVWPSIVVGVIDDGRRSHAGTTKSVRSTSPTMWAAGSNLHLGRREPPYKLRMRTSSPPQPS